MRTGGVPAALLLVLAAALLQVSTAGDIYWEGEEDTANEFLEVKDDQSSLLGHLKRFKRDWFTPLDLFSWDKDKGKEDTNDDDGVSDGKDDDLDNFGSGSSDKAEPEQGEKTLRVTFLVMEPYRTPEYSNRDSPEFQNFSRSLANSVDLLFENLPGTQKSSLVRIQSIITDDFWSNVTLDIVTTGYDDTDRIIDILHNHIKNNGRLGSIGVRDEFFKAQLIDPGTTLDCDYRDLKCDEDRCIPGSAVCDGTRDCNDGTDEYNCPKTQSNTYDTSNTPDTSDPYRNNEDSENTVEPSPDEDEAERNGYDDTNSNANNGDQTGDNGYDDNNGYETGDNGEGDEQTDNTTTNSYGENNGDQTGDIGGNGEDRTSDNSYDENRGDQSADNIYGNNDADQTGDNGYNNNNEYTTTENYYDNRRSDYGNGEEQTESNGNGEDETGYNGYGDRNYPTTTDSYVENRRPDYGTGDDQTRNNKYDENGTGDNGYRDSRIDTTTDNYYDNNIDQPSDYDDNRGQPDDTYGGNGNDQTFDNQNPWEASSTTSAAPSCTNPIPCAGSYSTICPEAICDGKPDCPYGDDEQDCIGRECPSDYLRCDETRCVPQNKRCDNYNDCTDGTDERDCPTENCGTDDFYCSNGKCIEPSKRCDRVYDCPGQEDEANCPCSSNEFRCESDGFCIEEHKRCDGVPHCSDSSDEQGCACSPEQWQCDHGNCIKRSQRCDGRVDCPTDRSDERNCLGDWYFRCKNGKRIPQHLRCNREYDCPSGDFSDEQNCPCGESDFKCDNGHCIPASKRCDRTHDCQDGSDERHCTYGKVCMAFECTSGICVQAESRCNGTAECDDGSDELNCPCKRGQYQCRDGSCINIAYLCNGRDDCKEGEDEYNCWACGSRHWQCHNGECVSVWRRCDGRYDCRDRSDEKHCEPNYLIKDVKCPRDKFTCYGGSVTCATKCDDVSECDGGEDEENCAEKDCSNKCSDGTCLASAQICDHRQDCDDGSDELYCDYCDGPNDFRCKSGECVSIQLRCNGGVEECADGSDELDCNVTMTASKDTCNDYEFQCVTDKVCINGQFYCDGNYDCQDESDEANCSWYMTRASRSPVVTTCHESQFTCYDGRCIPHARRCDNIYDCSDFSDEQNCYNTGIEYVRTAAASASCPDGGFQCASGGCVPSTASCDGTKDCADGSDELDCPTISPLSPGGSTTSSYYRPATDYPVYTTTPSIYGYTTRNPNSDYPYKNEDLFGGTRPAYRPPGGRGEPGYGGRGQPAQPGYDQTGDRRQPGYDQTGNRGQPGYGQTGDRGQPGYDQTSDRGQPGYGQTGDRRQPGYDQTSDRGRPGYDQSGGSGPPEYGQTGGRGRPGYEQTGDRGQPGYDPSGDRRQPGYTQSGQPEYDQSGERRQPGYDDGSKEQPGYDQTGDREQPGYDQTGDREQPGYDQTGDREQPGYDQTGDREQLGYDQTGGRGQPGYDQTGGRGQPGYDQTGGRGQPGYDQTGGRGQPGYDQSGGRGQPGYDQTGGRGQPGYDQSGGGGQVGYDQSGGRGQPGYDQTGGRGQPGYDQTGGRGQPGYDQAGGRGQPGYDQTGGRGQPGYDQSGGDGQTGDRGQPGYDQTGGRGQPGYGQSGGRGQPGYGQTGNRGQPGPWGAGQSGGVCTANQWRCENGPCIESFKRCNGIIDCPFDYSDEFDCPVGSPAALRLRTMPSEQEVRFGGDVVFQCRDEGPRRAPVRWVRDGGKPIKPGSRDVNGRLEMDKVTTADAGVYICQATGFLGQPGSEVRVRLDVQYEPPATSPPFTSCRAGEATCGNGECIPKAAVCDGRVDCSDRSDEENCHHEGLCEPNQHKCDNGKCVLKSWVCDSEDDCGDGSDERNCGSKPFDSQCSAVEFSCSSDSLCIPRSYHCDGHNDCPDGSDEIGCIMIHVTQPPLPSNLVLNPGETLILTCRAVGVPVPLISWRRNWGHVPPQCVSTSVDGVGTLTCDNIQTDHSGAYSCEAISIMGTNFATPDAIVFVNNTGLCPRGYFNNEARSESECIPCFCFGESTQCHSADLFTYNMPTPLGEGGTRLVGIKQSPNGEVQLDSQPINNQYFYEPLRNGATVTKLAGQGWSRSDSHPYLTLPETYNGNQLTSYGGHIKYTLSPQTQYQGNDNSAPTIIIKGKYGTLVHASRSSGSRNIEIEARLTPGDWMKSDSNGLQRASREDIMMALDDIEMILLRADFNNAGVNISNFAMESAQHINVGLGAASLVEECTCPKGYEGLSCQKCASGFVRKSTGAWLGACVAEECPAGTYGNPSIGIPCKPCPCPLTNPENQFAGSCSLRPDGNVQCDCFPGYEGQHCEYCASGYEGNPLVPGDRCQQKPTNNCNPTGTKSIRPLDECECKDNVQGRYCDQCKNGSFYLSSDFRQGCALCFCSGVTQNCKSSNFRRKTISVQFNVPQIVDQVKVYNSAPSGQSGFVRYKAPVESDIRPQLTRGDISFQRSADQSTVYYWSLPDSFAGDKVTSYGGYFRYTLKNVPTSNDRRFRNNAADIQLISDNSLTYHYVGNFVPSQDGILNVTVQLLEKGWQRPDGKEIARQHFLLALADVKTILIKASYAENAPVASPVSASIDVAEADAYGPMAVHVEQCTCPAGYIGTSCEDCAPGYTRSTAGLYLALCEPCECNGKSNMCNPETGVCYDCTDNTDGEHCELCKPGYEKDPYGQCVNTRLPEPCQCDPRGTSGPCDNSGICYCKQNVEGESCDRCRPGTFGLDAKNPTGCLACFCSGVTTDCHEANHYTRIPIAAPMLFENYGGYTITDLYGDKVIKDHFLPQPEESELMYIFQSRPDAVLYWSLPVFPGNRVLSYGGSISLRQKFSSDVYDTSEPGTDVILEGDNLSLFWTNPNQFRSGESFSYQIPLSEAGWYIQGSTTAATRSNFMNVLRNLKRVLVKATVVPDLYSTSIADVSMDIATQSYESDLPAAKGIEVCMCPVGYTGTSCESCQVGYYQDAQGYCRQCPCNGHGCQLDSYGQVICNCAPPYKGPDCSTIGLVMELHPKIHEANLDDKLLRKVTFTCKYRAPEPLTIKFYHEGEEQHPPRYYNESRLHKDGWHGAHKWQTVWDTRRQGEIYECHTITEKGFTLGILTTSLPEQGGDSSTLEPTRPPPPPPPPSVPTVIVRITSPKIKIQEVGSSVNFTCEALTSNTRARLPVKWSKSGGYLPSDRTAIDETRGLLVIRNLQVYDSGIYICESSDGVNTNQAMATLKVPGNEMTYPVVEVTPTTADYYEGDRIELDCKVSGNPAPEVRWQRATNRPLPLTANTFNNMLIIDSARVEDAGEYTCVGTNTLGSDDRTAVITVRPRPSWPSREKLTVSNGSPSVIEGQNVRIVCTGSANLPAESIDWVRQDNVIFLSNVRSENGVLLINKAVPENQGVYICQSAVVEVSPVPVLVTVINQGPPTDVPNITVSADSLRIPTGGSASVECNPLGRPSPQITWKKHDGEFGRGVSQRGNTLIINGAQEDDRGYYVCEAYVTGNLIKNIYVYIDIEKREIPSVAIWPEGEQAVTLGGEFSLMCRVLGGTPEPDVMWSRNGGRPLSQYAQIQPNHVLKFEKIEVNDEGEYTCTATNPAGIASASAVIKVRSAPEITITPGDVITVLNGDALSVECRANGYPEPMVSIKTVGEYREVVPPSPGYAALRVSSATIRDDGEYVCSASSLAGTIEEQFVVRVERGDGGYDGGDNYIPDEGGSGDGVIDPDDNPAGPYETPSSLIAFDNQPEVTIYCNTTGTVRWDRADGPLQRNAVQFDSRLIIYNVSKSDSGDYVCSVYNIYNEVQNAAYTRLIVISKPRITLRPLTQTVRPGQSPTVECVVEGDDILRVAWRPVNKIPSSRVDTRSPTLIFHQIEVEDAGLYECFAESRYANASATAEVIVSEDTDHSSSVSHANEQYAHAGSAVHLSCNATQRNVHIVWTKDGRAVPRSATLKSDGSLFIRLAQKSDSGRYVCSVRDANGRVLTSNYINLHIEGIECLDSEFRCYDYSGCVDETLLCDGFRDCQDNSDEENCLSRDKRYSDAILDQYITVDGPREVSQTLVSIDKPARPFRAGDNVQVMCKTTGRDTRVEWQRPGTNQYVDSYTYGGGAMLVIQSVTYPDAGLYRCVATDKHGRTSYDDFNLEIESGSSAPAYPYDGNDRVSQHQARLNSSVDLPCNHNLEQPVSIEWRREFSPLSAEIRANQPVLRLDSVTEADAGTYICRVSNSRATIEAKAILIVTDVIPKFDGKSFLSLPTLSDAFRQFEIEISFKPNDESGLILYNSENQGRQGDYIALQLQNGVPEFIMETGSGPLIVKGDRPLQLNAWHTIRISRLNSKVTMDVDNTGPFIAESSDYWGVLDLKQPLYIGGVPDQNQLPARIADASGYIGCVSMLILRNEEKNLMLDSLERYRVSQCDSCAPNLCLNGGVCQEARNERGYMCICPAGFAGLDCDRTGEACRPGLCGPGKCSDTEDGYKCACPVTHTGKNCQVKQSIEYPAFTGSTFLAIKPPNSARTLKMSMMIKAASPVTDGIIMYCAESQRGYGGFTSLAVRNGKLEYRYDLGGGSAPVVLVSDKYLPEKEWVYVQIARVGLLVSLIINQSRTVDRFEQALFSPKQDLNLHTPIFVGGVDESITLNNSTGVTGGFNGCIKNFTIGGVAVDIMNDTINSENVQECNMYDRGDIPEMESVCHCKNGGSCTTDPSTCSCPSGYTGQFCEQRIPSYMLSPRQPPGNPCAVHPCMNGGTCRLNLASKGNYSCDCPLGYAGATCQISLRLTENVGFNGDGYLELPASQLDYERLDLEPAVIAMAIHTTSDGVLLYQKDARAPPYYGDYLLLRIERGIVILDWDMGSGKSSLSINNVYVNDGERHQIIAKLLDGGRVSLSVDNHQNSGTSTGLSNTMNADSNIYIGGIPESINYQAYPGFTGCIEQIELMSSNRGLDLGTIAVTGRNTQRCNSLFPDMYPFFEEIEVFESPPPGYPFNSNFKLSCDDANDVSPTLRRSASNKVNSK